MAEKYDGPGRYEAVPDPVVLDGATGTPPFIPASWRTGIYIGAVIVDVLAFVVLGILATLGVMDRGVAAEIGLYVVGGISMVSGGLAIGYRPTRPGSPIAP